MPPATVIRDIPRLCRALAEASPMPTAAVEGKDHIVRYVNPAFCAAAAKPEQDLIGKPFGQVVKASTEGLALLDRVHETGMPEIYISEESPNSNSVLWSYRMWPVLGADQRPIAILVQAKETTALHHERTAVNQALIIASVRQHEELDRSLEELHLSQEELHQSHKDLQALTAQLIELQESGNRQLGRELHDDLAQRLAALGMSIANLRPPPGGPSLFPSERIMALYAEISKLAEDVASISRRLHPAILEEFGLEEALNEECHGFSARTGIPCEFKAKHKVQRLGADVSLCFYRVAQEGLNNIAKHAHATKVRLTLSNARGVAALRIEDNGQGFDPSSIKGKHSLGLISMRERARLVNGDFMVKSEPGKGTILVVSVSSQDRSAQEKGLDSGRFKTKPGSGSNPRVPEGAAQGQRRRKTNARA